MLDMLPAAFARARGMGIAQIGNPLPRILSAASNEIANMDIRVGNLIQAGATTRQMASVRNRLLLRQGQLVPFQRDGRVQDLLVDIQMMLDDIYDSYPRLAP